MSGSSSSFPKPSWLSHADIREEADAFLAEFWPERSSPIDIESIVDTRACLDIVPAAGIFHAYGINGFLSDDMTAIVTVLDEAIAFAKGHGLDPVDLTSEAQRDSIAEWIGRRLAVSGEVIRRRGEDDGHWKR